MEKSWKFVFGFKASETVFQSISGHLREGRERKGQKWKSLDIADA